METTGPQIPQDVPAGIKRESESIDDFEHLGFGFQSKDTPISASGDIHPDHGKVSPLGHPDVFAEEPVEKEILNPIAATKDFLADLTSGYSTEVESPKGAPESLLTEPFAFNKPLPDEPLDTSEFLKAEAEASAAPLPLPSDKTPSLVDDLLGPVEKKSRDPSPTRNDSNDEPPPVPKHQNIPPQEDSPVHSTPDKAHTPEPEFEDLKPPTPQPPPHIEDKDPEEPPKVVREKTPEPLPKLEPKKEEPAPPQEEPPKPKTEKEVKPSKQHERDESQFTADIGPKDIFVKYGLDAWFNPERLHPKVESLVYWRDPKKSGVVFGTLMVTLLSLTHFSLISVLAYLCLITLVFTISFRIYKNVMQAVQKTSDGHPFKAWLEVDISLSEEKVREMSEVAVARINRFVTELRRLFLVEDLIDSIKFAVALWALTNVGAWFNGLTLVIIGVVAMFTMPKVYENNKAQFDAYISLASAKLSEITNKVKAAVPMGKKEADKPKDQ